MYSSAIVTCFQRFGSSGRRLVKKTILCYGDSNTWGYDPATKERFPEDVRWVGRLRRRLGEGFEIISEGLNGRTTVWDDPIEEYRNGKTYLRPCLESHRPIDLVVLMLGTNDLKKRFSVSAFDIGRSVGLLLDIIHKSGTGPKAGAPKILLISPPPVGRLTEFAEMFEGAPAKSKLLAKHYSEQAKLYDCEFLDAGRVIRSSDIDGIHLEAEEHTKLAEAIAEIVRKLPV